MFCKDLSQTVHLWRGGGKGEPIGGRVHEIQLNKITPGHQKPQNMVNFSNGDDTP